MAIRVEAIASRFEAIASRVEAIAIWVEAMAIRVEAIAIGVEAIVSASSWYCRREAHEKESSVPYPRTGDHALATLVFGFTPVFKLSSRTPSIKSPPSIIRLRAFSLLVRKDEETKAKRRKGETGRRGPKRTQNCRPEAANVLHTVHEREGSVQGFCRSSL